MTDARRTLPSVDDVLRDPAIAGVALRADVVRAAAREAIARRRENGPPPGATRASLIADIVAELLAIEPPPPPRAINATGVLIHTNLGRVAVSPAAALAMATAAATTLPLEVEPGTGRRGDRQGRVGALLRALTGAKAAIVVNNNAAAVLLAVAALAAGRQAVVSRGEAVEVGGGFRIPDVLRQGGAELVEVGTTNRTYPGDYADAIGPATGMLLKVHPGNFVITGFTRSASVAELAPIARAAGVPVVEDQGSGLLLDGLLDGERSIRSCLSDGADLVTASGDKLLGGPQCGIVVGRADLIARLARHPLARALRVDKVTLAGLEATLRHYLRGEEHSEIPLWRQVAAPLDTLRERARRVACGVDGAVVVDSVATFGGGAAPGRTLPSVAVQVRPAVNGVDDLARRLRTADPGIWGRIEDGALLFDLRTVEAEDDVALAAGVAEAMRASH